MVDGAGSSRPSLDQFADPAAAAVDQFTTSLQSLLDGLGDDILRRIAIAKLHAP
jgi:hypothetical protein